MKYGFFIKTFFCKKNLQERIVDYIKKYVCFFSWNVLFFTSKKIKVFLFGKNTKFSLFYNGFYDIIAITENETFSSEKIL